MTARGRPKSTEPTRAIQVALRLLEDEASVIDEAARLAGLDRSTYVRTTVLRQARQDARRSR